MKGICIQLQPKKSSELKKENVLRILQSFGFSPEITEGNDDGPYINLTFDTTSITQTWSQLKHELLNCPGIETSAIITCEGSLGWDNYLLLHHFDPSQKLDKATNHG